MQTTQLLVIELASHRIKRSPVVDARRRKQCNNKEVVLRLVDDWLVRKSAASCWDWERILQLMLNRQRLVAYSLISALLQLEITVRNISPDTLATPIGRL